MSVAFLPASEGRSAPHMCVRRRSPRKSSKLCPYGEDAAESRITDYKLWGAWKVETSLDGQPESGLFQAKTKGIVTDL